MTHEEARAWAERWARSWFLDDQGADRLRVAGIDAGWASHVDAFDVLARLAAELVQPRDGAPRLSPLARVKALGFDRALRTIGLAAGRAWPQVDGPVRVAALVEIPTPSMTDSVALVARTLAARAKVSVWAADPRARIRLSSLGLESVSVALPLHRQARLVRDGRREAKAAWSGIRADPPKALLGDRDVTEMALTSLGPLVQRSVPWVAEEAEALRDLLGALDPPAILVASDQHRMGRIISQLAPDRVIVVQHGLPQAEVGYLPVVAGRVAVWSEASRAWFTEHGVPDSRLVVTGNPRFDALVAPRDGDGDPGGTRLPRGNPRILLALSPTVTARNRALLGMVLRGIAGVPAASLVVKLHPGQGDWSWVRGEVRRADVKGSVLVLRHDPLSRLLRWADTTIVHRSTVALDSLVAGTPVIVGVVDESPSVATAELESLQLPIARDPDELRATLLDVCGEGGRLRYFSSRHPAMEAAAGPLDGRSAERVAALAASR